MQEDNLLYHYTSIDTFSTMLEKSLWSANGNPLVPTHIVMWATHCNFLNDKTEYRLFVKGLKYQVKEYAENHGISLNAKQFELLDDAVKYNDTFVILFSKKADDLGMWRGYAGDGAGVCLGFDFSVIQPSSLSIVATEQNLLDEANGYETEFKTILKLDEKPEKCHYVRPEPNKMQIEKSLVKKVYNLLVTKGKDEFNDVKLHLKMEPFYPLYKHHKYDSEDEWRIVINDMMNFKYRNVHGQLVPYREVRIPIDCLKKIIIGPCLDSDVMVNRLITISKYRLVRNLEIVPSDIPYRNKI